MIFGFTEKQLRGLRVYGLTGGIASGKSEVSKRLAAHGFAIIDADKIGHEVIAPGGAAEGDVVEAFGDAILTNGEIDREKLGAVVFRDAEKRKQLNGIVHPIIGQAMARKLLAHAEAGNAIAVIDAPLLVEAGSVIKELDGLIVVACKEKTQVERLKQFRGMSEKEARRRIAAQAPVVEKLKVADWVIYNDGTLEELREKVDELAEVLKKHERAPR